jgi:hypothetical protein
MNTNFTNLDELSTFIKNKVDGHILVDYRALPDYEGIVLGIGIIFDTRKEKYNLDLEWVSFGLDLYSDILEGYTYKFETLEKLTDYLQRTYHISVTDIPIKYKYEDGKFPNPIYNADQKQVFIIAWERFQEDFRAKKFLDPSLELVYETTGEKFENI